MVEHYKNSVFVCFIPIVVHRQFIAKYVSNVLYLLYYPHYSRYMQPSIMQL